MRNILLFSILLFATSGFSQLVLESVGAMEGVVTDEEIEYTFTVTNSGTENESFSWQLDRDSAPAEWSFTVCDAVICYSEGQESSICGDPQFVNVLAPGESISWFKVGVHPNGLNGTHSVNFFIIRDCGNIEPENVVSSVEVTFNVSQGTSSVDSEEALTDDILLYPNPTIDEFKVKNDVGVKSLAIYNIVGKKVMTTAHKTGQSHDVSGLEKGIYLVRMLDSSNQSMKVIRLTKE